MAHWLALGVFTGEYIKVATQVPLIRQKQILNYCPFILIIVVIVTLGFCFFAYVAVAEAVIWMDWIEFTGKNFLAWSILTIQLLSVHAINKMINQIPGLKPLARVNHETRFVFFFFAIQATFESGLTLALDTYSKETTDRYTPQ
jgi:hypothetical protein